jgi:hypothetical protein
MHKVAGIVIALFCAVVTLVAYRTLSQDIFGAAASIRILGTTGPRLPVYWFVIGAFLGGLGAGLAVAAAVYIRQSFESFKKSRRIKDLEKRLRAGDSVHVPEYSGGWDSETGAAGDSGDPI